MAAAGMVSNQGRPFSGKQVPVESLSGTDVERLPVGTQWAGTPPLPSIPRAPSSQLRAAVGLSGSSSAAGKGREEAAGGLAGFEARPWAGRAAGRLNRPVRTKPSRRGGASRRGEAKQAWLINGTAGTAAHPKRRVAQQAQHDAELAGPPVRPADVHR